MFNHKLPAVGSPGFKKCSVHSVETIPRDKINGLPTCRPETKHRRPMCQALGCLHPFDCEPKNRSSGVLPKILVLNRE
ncbi:hypothetical protein TNCV_4756511 [Trichonephila clavipes]|nr:hypothetical protein TNCV_4756511 [Trichonephila clavipes]